MIGPYVRIATPPTPNWWPAKYPDATLSYSLDVSAAIDPAIDFIGSVSVSVAPSGAGEMQPSDPTVTGSVLTITMSGGQPTRVYTTRAIFTMMDGRIFEFTVRQCVLPELSVNTAPPPPIPGFGTPVVWRFTPSLDFRHSRNAALRLWGWN